MDNNYGYRYQLITGISLFKNEGDRKKVDKNERIIYEIGNHKELLTKSEIYKNFYEKQIRKD